MATITFKIKLMNRVKPEGMEDYKKRWKPPVCLRSTDDDHLNPFAKEGEIAKDLNAPEEWSKEIIRLQENTSWKIEQNPNYGDMLIGYITTEEFDGDFFREIYKPMRQFP